MTTRPQDNWYFGTPSYYSSMLENSGFVNESSVLDMNSPFEPGRGQSFYSGFPTQGYLPLVQEVNSQDKAVEAVDTNEQIKELHQAVSLFRQAVCERLDKLEKDISTTQDYIKRLVPWSIEVHDSYTKMMEVVAQTKPGTVWKQPVDENRGTQENNGAKKE